MYTEPHGVAIVPAAPAADRVALRRLDLDDLGAKISEQPRGEGPRDVVAELQ